MGAFDGFRGGYGVPHIVDKSERYIKNQSAITLYEAFNEHDLKKLYDKAIEQDESTIWVPSRNKNHGCIGLSTWYVAALLKHYFGIE